MFFRKSALFSEEDLSQVLNACLQGNPQAQRTLFKEFYSYAKKVCLRYASSPEEAEEILNDSFLKVFQRLHQYKDEYSFKGWLRSIVINTAISYHRKYHKLDSVSGLEPYPDISFNDNIVEQLEAEKILSIVQKLPPAQQMVFMMHVVDGYSLREIGDMIQCNEATVRSHYIRARRRLQDLIGVAYPAYSRSAAAR